MKRFLFFFLVLSLVSGSSELFSSGYVSQENISDGPHIYLKNDTLWILTIRNNKVVNEVLTAENFESVKKRYDLLFDFENIRAHFTDRPSYNQKYPQADSVCVISDIHGEYQTYLDLLKVNGIIDKKNNWKFGTGHLVILGDVFDRGDQVTEVLWHLFGLEMQAQKAGGMVHLILGNHEILVLSGSTIYTNPKYLKSELLTGIKYSDLFSDFSVLGNWLRTKPVAVTIDKLLFVHAGLSMHMIYNGMTVRMINRNFTEEIVGRSNEDVCEKDQNKFLSQGYGPVWYRGYFNDPSFDEAKIDSILYFYNKKNIIVGHTTSKGIKPKFNNKVIGVDAGIMNREAPEILLYKEGAFYKCCMKGKRNKI